MRCYTCLIKHWTPRAMFCEDLMCPNQGNPCPQLSEGPRSAGGRAKETAPRHRSQGLLGVRGGTPGQVPPWGRVWLSWGCTPQLSPGLPGRAGMEGACFWPCWGCRATSPRGAVGPVQPSALWVNRLPEPSWVPCVAVLRSPSCPRPLGKGLSLQIDFWEGPCPGEERAREAGWQGPGCWSPRCDSP